jgi:hypothetical protein
VLVVDFRAAKAEYWRVPLEVVDVTKPRVMGVFKGIGILDNSVCDHELLRVNQGSPFCIAVRRVPRNLDVVRLLLRPINGIGVRDYRFPIHWYLRKIIGIIYDLHVAGYPSYERGSIAEILEFENGREDEIVGSNDSRHRFSLVNLGRSIYIRDEQPGTFRINQMLGLGLRDVGLSFDSTPLQESNPGINCVDQYSRDRYPQRVLSGSL